MTPTPAQPRTPRVASLGPQLLAIGPLLGGVGDTFAQTVSHLSSDGRWTVNVDIADTSSWPFIRAVALLHRHRSALRRADVVHVEFGSNDAVVFWVALLLSFTDVPVLVVPHDHPLLVHAPAAGLLPLTSRWCRRIGYRLLSPLLDRHLRRSLLARSSAVAVLSDEARAGWTTAVTGELFVIPLGESPLSSLPPISPSSADYVLFAGFLGRSKGVDVLLRAWREVCDEADLDLVIAAEPSSIDDPELAALTDEAHGWPRPPRWVGFLPTERELEDTIAQAAVVVLPYRRSSPASGILARAMLEGRPVVASAVPAATRAIEDGVSGILTTPGDVGALATALRRLLTDGDRRDALGTAARARGAELFSSSRQVELLVDAYDRLVGSRRTAVPAHARDPSDQSQHSTRTNALRP
jgi:glycosyltransferase involved in cell wall biosynthesis